MFKNFCCCNTPVSDLYEGKSKNKIAIVFFFLISMTGFAVSKFNEFYSFVQLLIVSLKPEHAVTFIKCITNLDPLIFPSKPLISNKILLLGLNSLNVLGLV